jgi:hypothetical protein
MMTSTPPQRGTTRRVRVRSTQHYNVIRLQQAAAATASREKLSPAALWILLAYLPPDVRARPWVRHLVEKQLVRETVADPHPWSQVERASMSDRAAS